jgi:formamidopyrimidine-DNA glycosylase
MPELPEVETTVLSLKQKVLKKTFVCTWAENKEEDIPKLIGRKILDIRRFGKGIYIFLDDKNILFIHLRMTGHLLLGEWELIKDNINKKGCWQSKNKILQEKKNGFLRFVFFLDNKKQLALSDSRRFAKVSLLTPEEAEEKIKKLGPDPLLIKKEEFVNLFKNKKTSIKPLLMDQNFLSGVGNIYAAEVLFKAKINPLRKANTLKKEEIEKIYKFLQSILKESIKLSGDSTSDYRLLTGEKGGYQKHHLVYDRKGLPCFRCKSRIERRVVGGRGTYYCPFCQK